MTPSPPGAPRVALVHVDQSDRAGSITRFVEAVLADLPRPSSRLNLGELGAELVARIRLETGLNLAGFRHNVQSDELRHAWRRHGPAGEAGDVRPLTLEDVVQVGEHVASADQVIHDGATHQGLPVLRFEKRLGKRTIVIIAEVRANRRVLSFKTMYRVA